MDSIKTIYKIGNGPSSSHTMGPKKAAQQFLSKNNTAASYKVHLFGSLALTGRGHLTDVAILNVFNGNAEIVWHNKEILPLHTNGMRFEAFDGSGKELDSWVVYSIGGGELMDESSISEPEDIYPQSTMLEIMEYLEKEGGTLWEYVEKYEDNDIYDFLNEVWKTMKAAIHRGLETDGTLPGILKLQRKAPSYFFRAEGKNEFAQDEHYLFAYSLAVSEENAAGNVVVTAPTCGSCGILPASLYLFNKQYKMSEKRILQALATAGLVGNLVQENASISGAEVGCQGEVGVACAMAAAAMTQLPGGTIYQIEYAASSGLEHHLGLTCDPVAGLVQIPCIERNAFGAQRAMDAAIFAYNSDGRHYVHFDQVVEAMKQTGKDLPSLYKETSQGGLAKIFYQKRF